MREIKPKAPCGRNCPNRKVGCRSECEDFIKYDHERLEYYELRQEAKERSRRLHTERKK